MTAMNKLLALAGILAAATTGIHLVAGGNDIASPLLASSLAEEPRLTLYAVWHMASVAMGLSAIAFFVAAFSRRGAEMRAMVRFVSAMWLAFGAVFLVIAATQGGTGLAFKLPQWILLLPVGILGWVGARDSPGR